MSVHPSDDTLRDFAAGALSPTDLLGVDDHLAGCEACRARAARYGAADAALEELTEHMRQPLVHLSDEEVQLCAEGRLAEEQAFRIRRHLAECDVCQRQVDELSAWTRPSSSRLPAVAVAAAVLMIVGVSAGVWYSHRAASAVAAAPDVLRSLSPAARTQVDAALAAGAADLPAFMADLTPARETLMGGAGAPSGFEISGPAGTAVIEDTPTFAWQAPPDGGDYVVTVLDENGSEALRSPTLSETHWIAARPLPRDRTYIWQVSAERNGQRRIAPAPPAPPARFRVLDETTAGELQRLASRHPDAHLVLGILYMEAGVREQAMAELGRVRPDDPHADVARKSLDRLEASAVRPSH